MRQWHPVKRFGFTAMVPLSRYSVSCGRGRMVDERKLRRRTGGDVQLDKPITSKNDGQRARHHNPILRPTAASAKEMFQSGFTAYRATPLKPCAQNSHLNVMVSSNAAR